jgi:anaerobic ribonucleoside-triphosphate reductase activating protein
MNFHLIKHDDMNNGPGLREVLFVSGCIHHCDECHNPETWDLKSGKEFTENDKNELINRLKNDYIQGLTLSGGDPIYNLVLELELLNDELSLKESSLWLLLETIAHKIDDGELSKELDLWIYTGYTFDFIKENFNQVYNALLYLNQFFKSITIVDGKYDKNKTNGDCHWRGSTNQNFITL